MDKAELITTSGACRRYQINLIVWRRAIAAGRIPGPTHPGRTPKRLAYTIPEAAMAAMTLYDQEQPEKTLSIREAAETLGVKYSTARVVAWTHQIGERKANGRVYLTNADVQRLGSLTRK